MKTRPSKRVMFVTPPVSPDEEDAVPAQGLLDTQIHDHPTASLSSMFTVWNEIVLWCSLLFYVADLCLDLYVCAAHFMLDEAISAWFIFFCILLPNLYAGYKSLQWYLRAHEQTPIRRPSVWIIRVIFFPISPILRYIDAWVFGRRARRHWRNQNLSQERKNFESYVGEIAEVALLRLVIIFLEDAPIVVLNLAKLLQTPPGEALQPQDDPPSSTYHPTSHEGNEDSVMVARVRLGSVVAKLACTMTLGVVHYMSCNKMAWHLANTKQKYTQDMDIPRPKESWETKGVLSWSAEVFIYCWHLLAIGSRVMAYAMLWVVHLYWLWLPISLRWVIHSLWIYFDVAEMSLVNSVAFGGVYLFSFVTTSPGRQILRILLYYVITLSEHVIIALLWHFGSPDNPYHDLGIGIIFGGAAGGMLFLCLYYGFFHPNKQDTWFRQWLRQRTHKEQTSGEE